jgi:hypothetical protein
VRFLKAGHADKCVDRVFMCLHVFLGPGVFCIRVIGRGRCVFTYIHMCL